MKRLIAAAGLALAAASTAACGGTPTSAPATVTVTASPPPAYTTSIAPVATPVETPHEMDQWVNAGQLDFKVIGACPNCPQFVDEPPGQYVGVILYVSNTSTVPQTYLADAQMLVDDQGRVFAPTRATTTNELGRFDLNPGTTSDMLFLNFAVPPGTALNRYTLVVHGSPTSVGSPIHLHEVAR